MATNQLRRQWAWLGTGLITAAGLTLPLAPRFVFAQPPQAPPSPIAAAPVIEREVAAAQTFVATVRPTRTVVIGSAASGRVAEYLAEEGDRVEAMQALANLLTETISSEIDAAEAELELRESELAELENGARPEEIEQAKARMEAADARRQYAAAKRERIETLFQSGNASSVEERDEAIALAIEAENNYLDAKAAYELAVAGPRPEKIAQAKATERMQAAVVEKLKDQERKHTIISRFDGYIISEHTEVGAWLNTGDPVYEMAALDEVDVEAFVTEQQVPAIHTGMEINVELPALNNVFTGRVTQVVPQADLKTRTFPVRIRVTNVIEDGEPLIKAGMLARVKLPIGDKQQAKLIPKDALVFAGSKVSVLVIEGPSSQSDGGTVRSVDVDLGVAQGELIQVIGELEAGQLVVVEGNERLRPGQNVRIAEVRK